MVVVFIPISITNFYSEFACLSQQNECTDKLQRKETKVKGIRDALI